MNAKTISIITPSFNQALFLPECLNTVAIQTFKPLEHIVLDPGSSDGSREIVAQAKSVTLVAEPDKGQSDAICKGFAMASGDVLGWLNSDDRYPSDSILQLVMDRFNQPDRPDVVYGKSQFIDEKGEFIKKAFVNPNVEKLLYTLHYQVGIIQPSVFIHRRVFQVVGGPSDIYNYTMDYEYWVRIHLAGFKWVYIDSLLSEHRWWPGMKTAGQRGPSLIEHLKTVWHHFGYVHSRWAQRYAEFLVNGTDGIINAGQDLGPTKHLVDKVKAQILNDYNGCYSSYQIIFENRNKEPWKETYEEMKRLNVFDKPIAQPASNYSYLRNLHTRTMPVKKARGIAWDTWLTVNENEDYFWRYQVGDNFDWLFSIKAVEEEFSKSAKFLEILSRQRNRDTCVVVGNGPSLQEIDLDLLHDQDVIISNYAYYNQKLLKYARYLTTVNQLVAEQGCYEMNSLKNVIKVFPFWLSYCLNRSENTLFLNANLRPEFSKDAIEWISWRSTVSFFNLQFAYALGYKKILLIGFDHSYKQASNLVEGDVIDQKDDDENHFDPNYFKGKKWQAADVDNMEASYRLAKKVYEDNSREIVNCTVGGKLEIFRRAKLENELRSHTKYTLVSLFNGISEEECQKKEESILNDSSQRILKYKNKHKGERCVIIGNGSSLNNMDLSFLKNEISFGLNRIYLGFETFDFIPTYYVAVNDLLIKQSYIEISKIPCTKFISNRGIKYLQPQENLIFIKTHPYSGLDFSVDLLQGCQEGATTTYVAMQLAYYMGFDTVILIGVDHSYCKTGIPGQEVIYLEPDLDHFSSNYCSTGTKWNMPSLTECEKYYKIAMAKFWLNKRQIIDATLGGRCNVFIKKSYKDVFNGKSD